MVKWHFEADDKGNNYVTKTVLAGPQPLEAYL
jgi:hypothetical protein